MYYTLGMEITDIAQIVTGIATLVVALILVSQLYQQHKDTEIQLTMDSWQLNQSLILAEIRDVDLSEILSKSEKGLSNLTADEEIVFNKFENRSFCGLAFGLLSVRVLGC